jgi:triacylglycerol lipase
MAINMKPFPEQAAFFAKCSELAYLDSKQGIPKFKELGFDANFIDVDGSQAYFLKNNDDLVFVCRGTEPTEFKDIAADLKAFPVPSSTGIGKVHRGFKESADDVWDELKEKIDDYGKTRTIWITGHSLGAAMATLISYRLQRSEELPNPQALFTFGSPKVGNKEYIKGIEASGILHFRFVNNADIVTRVPPWPYKHFGGMYYMNHWGNIRAASGLQLIQDRLRGFIKGLQKGEINFFSNHSIPRYVANLERWAAGEERSQDQI